MGDVVYKPSEWQTEFHECTVRVLLGAGAAGVGKTIALYMDPWQQIINETMRATKPLSPTNPYPIRLGDSAGWALHLRRELTELVQTIENTKRVFPKLDPGADYIEKTNMWRFSCGYKFQFAHCKDSDDHQKYLSNEYTHVGFDELTQFEKRQFDGICSRNRTSDPVLMDMLKIRACSNPGKSPGAEPDWVRRMFVDPCKTGRRILSTPIVMEDGSVYNHTAMYLPGKLKDNPNKQFARIYEQNLRSLPEHERKKFLEGNWYYIPGAFFGTEWDDRVHVVRPYRIPRDWVKFRSLDWGFKTAGCVTWWALDEDENMVCFEEFYFKGLVDKEVAERIKQIELRHGLWDKRKNRSKIAGPADNQLWEERGDSGKTKADVFDENGVEWSQADKRPGSRKHHAQRMTKRLKSHEGRSQLPGIMFFQNCVKCISTIPQLPTDEINTEEPKKGGDDHAYDSCAYAVAYASNGAANIGMSKADDEIEDEWSLMTKKSVLDKDDVPSSGFGYFSNYSR